MVVYVVALLCCCCFFCVIVSFTISIQSMSTITSCIAKRKTIAIHTNHEANGRSFWIKMYEKVECNISEKICFFHERSKIVGMGGCSPSGESTIFTVAYGQRTTISHLWKIVQYTWNNVNTSPRTHIAYKFIWIVINVDIIRPFGLTLTQVIGRRNSSENDDWATDNKKIGLKTIILYIQNY